MCVDGVGVHVYVGSYSIWSLKNYRRFLRFRSHSRFIERTWNLRSVKRHHDNAEVAFRPSPTEKKTGRGAVIVSPRELRVLECHRTTSAGDARLDRTPIHLQ